MARTLWSDTLVAHDVAIGGQTALSLVVDFSTEEMRLATLTLMRTIIGLDIGYTVHDSGEGSAMIDMGIGIASQEAFAGGTLPDPNAAGDFPVRGWVFRARGRVFGFIANDAAVYSWRLDRDIRARRKLDNGEAFVVWNNTTVEGAGGVVRVTGLIRTLWLAA